VSIGAIIVFGAGAAAMWALERARKKRQELTGERREKR
jgi:hypothetical protein